ncbi:MAG: hypothetical protein QOF78_83 [Phycisphaerales bacterium]|nr:hypothetical protein [Phycisphaerales bacterium]
MGMGTIKVAACALFLAAAGSGCASMQEKFGLGSETANTTEQVAGNAIDAQSAGSTMNVSDTGAGRQIGSAAGKEAFKKIPFFGEKIGAAVGSKVEKGVHKAVQKPAAAAPVQPVVAPAQP